MSMKYKAYQIKPSSKVKLKAYKTDDDGHLNKKQAEEKFEELRKKLVKLHEMLFVENKRALLIVLQAMDTGGKDSTIRQIFSGVNPQSCNVASFKAPSDLERSHDFLWRVHQQVPRRGFIGIFNRSHYEDVLITRVKNLVPKQRWEKRYQHINNFEAMLHDEGTTVLKFFLHISKDYQKARLQKRLNNPQKNWKLSVDDIKERVHWNDYQKAYEEMLSHCSTKHSPWYVIPAEHRWYRDLLIASAIVDTLESFKMKFPKPDFDPRDIEIR